MYGEKIRQLRKKAGLNQAELAEKVGISRPNISFWEHSMFPPLEAIFKVCKALNVNIGEFFGDQQNPAGETVSEEARMLDQSMQILDSETRSDLFEIFNNLVQKYLKCRLSDSQIESEIARHSNKNTHEIQQKLAEVSEKMQQIYSKDLKWDTLGVRFYTD